MDKLETDVKNGEIRAQVIENCDSYVDLSDVKPVGKLSGILVLRLNCDLFVIV